MSTERRDTNQHWHLDKRVPLAIILGFIIQTIYFTIFITKLDSRVSTLELNDIETRKTIKDMAEIRIHQQYNSKKLDDIDRFLRNDVEWVPPKKVRK